MDVAVFGGGCFWCLDALFRRVEGVAEVVCGYAGGATTDPDYESVCSGATGHAEVVHITFDPQKISYEELLEMFFACHDPTTRNRQGHDIGTQYRSVVVCRDERQRRIVEEHIGKLNADQVYGSPVVTEVLGQTVFHPAEDYHQNYFERHPGQGYCAVVIQPKMEKFSSRFKDRLRA